MARAGGPPPRTKPAAPRAEGPKQKMPLVLVTSRGGRARGGGAAAGTATAPWECPPVLCVCCLVLVTCTSPRPSPALQVPLWPDCLGVWGVCPWSPSWTLCPAQCLGDTQLEPRVGPRADYLARVTWEPAGLGAGLSRLAARCWWAVPGCGWPWFVFLVLPGRAGVLVLGPTGSRCVHICLNRAPRCARCPCVLSVPLHPLQGARPWV